MRALLIVLLLLSWGCGDSGNNSRDEIVGSWMLTEWNEAITLNSDGTANYTYESDGMPYGMIRGNGKWKVEGTTLTITITDCYFEVRSTEYRTELILDFSMSGETMTATVDSEKYLYSKYLG
jgi:hypothetical protein